MGDWELGLWALAALIAAIVPRPGTEQAARPSGFVPGGRAAVEPPAAGSIRLGWPPGVPWFARAAPF